MWAPAAGLQRLERPAGVVQARQRVQRALGLVPEPAAGADRTSGQAAPHQGGQCGGGFCKHEVRFLGRAGLGPPGGLGRPVRQRRRHAEGGEERPRLQEGSKRQILHRLAGPAREAWPCALQDVPRAQGILWAALVRLHRRPLHRPHRSTCTVIPCCLGSPRSREFLASPQGFTRLGLFFIRNLAEPCRKNLSFRQSKDNFPSKSLRTGYHSHSRSK